MPIDKSWIGKPRNTTEYAVGLRKFLDFAFMHQSIEGRTIKCPCSKCGFKKWQSREIVEEHLTCRSFPENYKVWYLHGETSNVIESNTFDSSRVIREPVQPQNPMETMINDAFGFVRHNVNEPSASFEPTHGEETSNRGSNEDNLEAFSEISSSDPVGVVLGKEHPGYTRGMGMGVLPTIAFKHKTTRLNGMNFNSSNGCNKPSQPWQHNMEIALKALLNYFIAKEGGRIPEELAGVFASFTQEAPNRGSRAPSPNVIGRSSDTSNTHESSDR